MMNWFRKPFRNVFLVLSVLAFRQELIAQYHVLFQIRAPVEMTGDSLFLAGTFNRWNPADSGFMSRKVSPGNFEFSARLTGGQHAFKFTRGSWDKVECGATGFPVDNRFLLVRGDTLVRLSVAGWTDAFPSSAARHTASPQVHLLDTSFLIPQLGRTRRIWIYLPKEYALSEKRFPVLYMQDGQNLFDQATSFAGEWGVDECLDSMSSGCIVVGIDHGGSRRLNEYAPFDMERYGKGEGQAYAAFLATVLKPFVDAHWRTLADPAHTIIAGSSMGGLIATYTILRYPRIFGVAGVFSPAYWINPGIFDVISQLRNRRRIRIYLYAGEKESDSMVPDSRKAFQLFSIKPRTETRLQVKPGAGHNEAAWRAAFPEFCRWALR